MIIRHIIEVAARNIGKVIQDFAGFHRILFHARVYGILDCRLLQVFPAYRVRGRF